MHQILKQLAVAVAGGLITLVLIGIWDWASDGGIISVLGGVTVTQFQHGMDEAADALDDKFVRMQKEVRKAIDEMQPTRFGEWEPRGVEVDHTAETDGFVAVASAGKTLGFSIRTWTGDRRPVRTAPAGTRKPI